jgi:hypothetical protein
MTSSAKIAANRANARKSRGPRTAAGKAEASRNAWRHGLSTISRLNPAMSDEIERMATDVCGGEHDPQLREQALIFAENTVLLRFVRTEMIAVIERLRDIDAVALAKGDNGLAVAKARSQEADIAWQELIRLWPKYPDAGYLRQVGVPQVAAPESSDEARPVWKDTSLDERDEFETLREAIPDLERLARYERRAWSRQKRAVRMLIAIKARGQSEHF